MLSKIKNLCKRKGEWIKKNERDLFLAIVIFLVAAISFGLGRLSKIREEKTPITIENTAAVFNTTATSMSDIDIDVAVVLKNKNSNDKVFVASKNGKKYYYAWCESAKIIKEQNRIWFATKDEAEKAGYEPAANCRGLK